MKTGLFIVRYNDFYAVEFASESLGIMLYQSKEAEQAETELARFKSMSNEELMAFLTNY